MHKSIKVAVRVACTFLFLLGFVAPNLWAETTEETLKKDFPNFLFDSIQPTPINGVFAIIYAGQEVVYYLPENGVLITGEMIAKGGVNMTEEVKGALLSRHYKEIPLDIGIKVGTGKHTVVEITDPNCPYCRAGAKYFAGKTDVTRYILFWPLSPESEQKVRHILCAKDRAKMFEEVMAGKFDEGATLSICQDPGVEALMKTYKELGAKIGMSGTPVYFINGKAVRGSNIPLIEVMLAEDAAKAEKAPQTPAAPAPKTETPKAPEAPKKP